MKTAIIKSIALFCLLVLGLSAAAAQGAGKAGRAPVALVLVPGAGGVHPMDFLVRTADFYAAAGFATQFTTSASQARSLVDGYKAQGYSVTLVGMSLGAVTVAQAVANGARPDKVVFAAGGLMPPGTPNGSVIETIGDPAILPRTLVLHHRGDECHLTPPEAVAPFVRWSRGRASARWISGGGGPGMPCRPNTPHTFTGREREAASAIIAFANAR